MDEDLSYLFGNSRSNTMASIVQLVHGSQTFKSGSNKVNVFAMRADGTAKRDFPNKVLTSLKGTNTKTPAALDGYKDHGMWYGNRYTAKDNTILMLQASTTYRGAPYNNGCMLLLLRSEASMLDIKVNLSANHNAVYEKLPTFSGNADIITVKEAEDYGIVLYKNFIDNYFDEEELEELFDVTVLNKGTKRPELLDVKSAEGTVRKVPVNRESGRRVRIRR